MVVGKPQSPVTWTASQGCHNMRAYSTGTSKPERVPEVTVFLQSDLIRGIFDLCCIPGFSRESVSQLTFKGRSLPKA